MVGLRLWSHSVVVPTVIVVLLLVVAASFAQSPTGLPQLWTADAVSWWMVAVPALGWLGGLTLVMARTMPQPRFRRALLSAAVLELALFITAAVLLVRLERQPEILRLGRHGDTLPLPIFPPLPFPVVDPRVVVGLFGLAIAGGFVLLLLTLWEMRRRLSLPRGELVRDPRYGRGHTKAAERALVLDAIARARAGLVSEEDVRRAVIASYASLEQSVTRLGADRSRAQTPAEFLHAVVASGVVHRSSEAEELLELFHRARFSHLPMDAEDRQRALECLEALQRDLSETADQRP